MKAVTVNDTQRLFVIPCGKGYSCLGFDVVFKRISQFAKMLGLDMPKQEQIGQLVQYQQYLEAERAYIATSPKETFYSEDTPPAVKAVLEAFRKNGGKLRVFVGDATTGKDWLEENDVIGTISRSLGPIRIPLLCESNSGGGFALLTENIVRLVDATTKRELYRHPTYHRPELTVAPGSAAGYESDVLADGAVHARFKSSSKAHDYIAFLSGTRMKR